MTIDFEHLFILLFSHSFLSYSLWPHGLHSTAGFPVLHHLLEFTQTHVHWVSDAIQTSHLLSSPSAAFNLSQLQGLFQWVSSSHQVAEVLELQLQSSNEYSGLIFFRIDWFGILYVQGTEDSLKSILQHHSSKTSFLRHSVFFMVQLSHLYMTPGKTIALTRQTFVEKVMSLLFNMLSRFVITFLTRRKHVLISWLQSLSLFTIHISSFDNCLFRSFAHF